MVRNRVLRKATWLLEVPGYEGDGPGKADVDILKALRDHADLPEVPNQPRLGSRRQPPTDPAPRLANIGHHLDPKHVPNQA